jgi:hypothetical protein
MAPVVPFFFVAFGLIFLLFKLLISQYSIEPSDSDWPITDLPEKIWENELLCYNPTMDRAEAIARLRAHETELKRLGVQHLYLFGLNRPWRRARGFRYRSLLRLRKRKAGPARADGCQGSRRKDSRPQDRHHDPDSIHKALRQRIEAAAVPVF